ncbi:MAG TPA: SRPBCC family protein [Acidimicrobiales bacterium]|nr:SRPBCC family protein [Acidimicrobiales bacterium]
MASLRHERRIAAPANAVWDVVRRPEGIVAWFPGITEVAVEGTTRTITTATGLVIPERIMAIDDSLRRFAYTITAPLYRFHLGVIDVFELGPCDSLCVYSTTAEPDMLCLVVAGATVAALEEIERIACSAVRT